MREITIIPHSLVIVSSKLLILNSFHTFIYSVQNKKKVFIPVKCWKGNVEIWILLLDPLHPADLPGCPARPNKPAIVHTTRNILLLSFFWAC